MARSYHGVGIDELCAAADVRKGSFYWHFASKSELAKAVIDLHADAFLQHFEAPPDTPLRGLRAVADAIAAIQAGFVSQFGQVVGCPFGNLAAELSTTDDDVREHLAATMAQLEGRLAEICRPAAEQGLLRDGVDPDQLARMLMAQYHGAILLAKVNASNAHDLAGALHAVITANVRDLDARPTATPALNRPEA
jgi:TetR/AcrR family transcriptional repressor of nem operon